ncbi:replication protein RepA [Paracraurococcus lichenis]|uniref:Replication protein RepA n=1 Tax=Paracraurococcus lichenis TaxID=3064888 RepID=A0ABT9E6I9_9PROT|nr:replication protein RepA [Paracraurococcus sp. LOR1-02]MDO9711791.1 replication protein RepA [Paracraurococcus sp. LOR1-02]
MGQVHQLILTQGIEAARAQAMDKAERMAVDAAFGVLSDEKGRIGITHAGFAMAALPHKKTLETIWKKDAGPVRLLVESGNDAEGNPVGIPYGSIARMILLYLQTQAVRTRSREVELGASMNAWLNAMDIPAGGKTYQIVREQSRRISRCRLTFFRRTDTVEMVTNGAFVRDAILPLDSTAAQLPLWQDRVRLDEGFYQSLIDHPLPLREEAVRQISNRSMAIDFYVWLAYRLHALDRPVPISWAALKSQFGQSYAVARKFRRDATANLVLALAVYPEAKLVIDDKDGLILYPSPPPVAERRLATA